ncbi:Zinc metalloprotease-like protein [Gryllus bimaculatus]|nr:Zinc metalloprotease-like protein [Gryllus bimaculatus]
MVLLLERSGCGCTLKTGTIVIGVLQAGQRGLCAALSVAGALQLVLSVLLLYGADYENPRLVKPWVLFSMVLTSAIVAVYFGLAVLTFALGGHRKVGYAILVGILGTTALSTYFILVVYSFYRELVERSVVPCII